LCRGDAEALLGKLRPSLRQPTGNDNAPATARSPGAYDTSGAVAVKNSFGFCAGFAI
jgi:hypothetical protein